MRRHILSLGSVGLLLLLLGAQVFLLGRPAAAATNIDVWYCWNGKEADFFDGVIKQFNQSHPDIHVTGHRDATATEKVIGSITSGNPPDAVLMCNQDSIPGWAAQGAIMPLDSLIKEQHIDLSDVIPTSLQWVTYEGKLYALPFLQDDYGLYWNKTLFKAAGLDPNKPPTTLEELDQYAAKLTKRDSNGRLIQMGYIPNWPGTKFDGYAHLFGCSMYDDATAKITADDPACIKMVQWVKSYYDKYGQNDVFNFVAGFGNPDTAENAFLKGQVAMMWEGEWMPGPAYIKSLAPNLDYGTAPFPAPAATPQLNGTTVLSGNPIFIPKGAKHVNQALTFMSWLMTPEPTKTMAIALSSVPQLKSLVNDPAFSDPHFKIFLQLANGKAAFTDPMISVWSFYKDTYSSALDEVLHGKKSPQQAMDGVTKTVQSQFDKQKK